MKGGIGVVVAWMKISVEFERVVVAKKNFTGFYVAGSDRIFLVELKKNTELTVHF
jgi:hypothetical protein